MSKGSAATSPSDADKSREKLLTEVASLLLLSDGPHEILNHIYKKLSKLLEVETFFNFLVVGDGQRMRLYEYGGISAAEAKGIEWLDSGQGICGSVARDKKKIVVNDAQNSSETRTGRIRTLGITAYCCHPLIAHGMFIGTLAFGSRKRTRFTSDEVKLMGAVSDLVASALERHNLVSRLRDANVELENKIEKRTSELREKQEELEVQAEELEAQTEELRVNNDELEKEMRVRKRAEEAHLQLAAIVEASSDAIISKTIDGTITSWNKGAERVYGYRPEEVVGKPISILAPRDSPDEIPHLLERIRRGEAVVYYDTQRVRKDGGVIDVSLTISPLKDYLGNIVGAATIARDITERKRGENALHESEEKFRLLADFTFDWETWSGPKGDFIYVSPSSERVTGHSADEFYDDPALLGKIVHPDDRTIFNRHLDSHLHNTSARGSMDFRIVMPDGETRWLNHVCQPVFGDDGKWLGRRASNRDITERKLAEDALKLTQASVDGAAEMVVWFTSDGNVHYVNDATCRTLGYSREELMNMTALDFSPDFTREQYEQHWREVRERKSFTLETTHRRKDGSIYPAEVLVNYVQYEGREFIFAYGRDITLRKQSEVALQEKQEELEAQTEELEANTEELRANNEELSREILVRKITEEALQESEDRFRALADNIPNLAWMANADGWIFWYNKQWYDYTGTTPEEMQGWGWQKVHHPDYVKAVTEEWSTSIKAGKPYDNIFPLKGKDGNYRWFLTRVTPIRDEHGIIQRWFGTNTDITARKQAEEDLKDEKMQAELYLDLMGHDISNMHQIAISQLELAHEIMDEEGKLAKADQELIDTPLATLERSARLIENVRKLQKLRSGSYKLDKVDLGKMLAEVVDVCGQYPHGQASIRYVPVKDYYVEANSLLKDVFNNLIINAIKHSNGQAQINVNINKARENGSTFYEVAVEDNGPGIPDARKKEVFHRFKRGQTTARGTGLGLYIVKTLVESFHGSVKLEDRVPGDSSKGSRFVVTLPATEK